MQRPDKYSQHSSIIWPVWLNGSVFVYELSGCGFESSCSHNTLPSAIKTVSQISWKSWKRVLQNNQNGFLKFVDH